MRTSLCALSVCQPNDELLQGYGFCLYPNDADLFYIRIGLTSGQESKAQLEPAETLATEERGTPTAQARQELLWRMGVAAEYQLSLKDPLPKALFDSSLLCLQSEASAYMSSGIGWEVVSEISLAKVGPLLWHIFFLYLHAVLCLYTYSLLTRNMVFVL